MRGSKPVNFEGRWIENLETEGISVRGEGHFGHFTGVS